MNDPGRLHILTDVHLQQRFSHADLARFAFAGGADVVQYREKISIQSTGREEVKAMVSVPRKKHQRLIVNDNVLLAKSEGADGVHVGMEDMDTRAARGLLGPLALIGATVHNLLELELLRGAPIDYIGVGPVFGTTSKETKLPPLGLAGLEKIAALSSFPVIAIGSITPAQVKDVLAAGAYGVAVLSCVCLDPNPEKVVRTLADILS